MGWIQERIAQEREADERFRAEQHRRFAQRNLSGRIPALWQELADACKACVADYREAAAATPENTVTFSGSETQFIVEKTWTPGSSVSVAIRMDPYRVEYEQRLPGRTLIGIFDLRVMHGEIRFFHLERFVTAEEAARIALEPVLFPPVDAGE